MHFTCMFLPLPLFTVYLIRLGEILHQNGDDFRSELSAHEDREITSRVAQSGSSAE